MDQSVQGFFVPAAIVIGVILTITGAVFGILFKVTSFFLNRYITQVDSSKTEILEMHESIKTEVVKVAEPFISIQKEQKEVLVKLNESVTKLSVTMDHVQRDALTRHDDITKRIDEHQKALELIRNRNHESFNELSGIKLKADILWNERENRKLKGSVD